jgi:hypothetical protein
MDGRDATVPAGFQPVGKLRVCCCHTVAKPQDGAARTIWLAVETGDLPHTDTAGSLAWCAMAGVLAA